jgi:hypothetical protein
MEFIFVKYSFFMEVIWFYKKIRFVLRISLDGGLLNCNFIY